MYAMPPRGRSCAPPAPPSPPPLPPQEPAPQAGEEDEEDDEFYPDLLDDGQAEEAAKEQRALLVSFETRCRDEAARHFMVAERRAAMERVAEAQATARATAHRHNSEAARSAAAVTEQRLVEED
jgi:hypothetical protein